MKEITVVLQGKVSFRRIGREKMFVYSSLYMFVDMAICVCIYMM